MKKVSRIVMCTATWMLTICITVFVLVVRSMSYVVNFINYMKMR